MDEQRWQRRIERERRARQEAEHLLEERSRELYYSHEATQELNRHLEEKVEARTRELENARDEALLAARAKSDFLATMSHELRTPLNGVIGLARMLMDTHLNPEQLELTETLNESARTLVSIINDVLDFAKIDADRMQLEEVSFNLHKLIRQLAALQHGVIEEKHLQLIINCADDVPEQVVGDPLRIRQIITNFLSNAIKFTHQGFITIHLQLIKYNEVECFRIAVQDTGIGIPPDVQAHILTHSLRRTALLRANLVAQD